MKTIEVQLDEPTFERVQQLARERAQTVAEVAEALVAHSPELPPSQPLKAKPVRTAKELIGSWALDADEVEEMVEQIMQDRERRNNALLGDR